MRLVLRRAVRCALRLCPVRQTICAALYARLRCALWLASRATPTPPRILPNAASLPAQAPRALRW